MKIFLKQKVIRAPSLLLAAKGRSCVKCGAEDGTIVRAHYSGKGSLRFGKGTAIKGHDIIAADLCVRCHTQFDSHVAGNDYEACWEFLMLCFDTLVRDWRDNKIGLIGKGKQNER
jgi:hypothetical protein